MYKILKGTSGQCRLRAKTTYNWICKFLPSRQVRDGQTGLFDILSVQNLTAMTYWFTSWPSKIQVLWKSQWSTGPSRPSQDISLSSILKLLDFFKYVRRIIYINCGPPDANCVTGWQVAILPGVISDGDAGLWTEYALFCHCIKVLRAHINRRLENRLKHQSRWPPAANGNWENIRAHIKGEFSLRPRRNIGIATASLWQYLRCKWISSLQTLIAGTADSRSARPR